MLEFGWKHWFAANRLHFLDFYLYAFLLCLCLVMNKRRPMQKHMLSFKICYPWELLDFYWILFDFWVSVWEKLILLWEKRRPTFKFLIFGMNSSIALGFIWWVEEFMFPSCHWKLQNGHASKNLMNISNFKECFCGLNFSKRIRRHGLFFE